MTTPISESGKFVVNFHFYLVSQVVFEIYAKNCLCIAPRAQFQNVRNFRIMVSEYSIIDAI